MQCLLVGIWEFSYSNTFAKYVYQFIVGFKIAQVRIAEVPNSFSDGYACKTNEWSGICPDLIKRAILAPFSSQRPRL